MADLRFLVSWGPTYNEIADWMSNTLYFAVDPVDPTIDYQALADDLRDIYQARSWTAGCKIEVRAYNMGDDKPRPERAFSTVTKTGTQPDGPHQVALCLSYYAERNLPQQRGRIYCGPFAKPGIQPTTVWMQELIDFAGLLAGLGGLNVDWSVYSPTRANLGQDPTSSITNVWVDNSWDIQRRRKLPASSRQTAEVQ